MEKSYSPSERSKTRLTRVQFICTLLGIFILCCMVIMLGAALNLFRSRSLGEIKNKSSGSFISAVIEKEVNVSTKLQQNSVLIVKYEPDNASSSISTSISTPLENFTETAALSVSDCIKNVTVDLSYLLNYFESVKNLPSEDNISVLFFLQHHSLVQLSMTESEVYRDVCHVWQRWTEQQLIIDQIPVDIQDRMKVLCSNRSNEVMNEGIMTSEASSIEIAEASTAFIHSNGSIELITNSTTAANVLGHEQADSSQATEEAAVVTTATPTIQNKEVARPEQISMLEKEKKGSERDNSVLAEKTGNYDDSFPSFISSSSAALPEQIAASIDIISAEIGSSSAPLSDSSAIFSSASSASTVSNTTTNNSTVNKDITSSTGNATTTIPLLNETAPDRPPVVDPERRKLDAKLSIVYSYLQREDYDKALQQLQVIMKKYEKRSSSSSRRRSVNPSPSSSSAAAESLKEMLVELYALRAQLYAQYLQQPIAAKDDYLTIFLHYSQSNVTVNRWLVSYLQQQIHRPEDTAATLSLFQQLLPILPLTEPRHLQQYLELVHRQQAWDQCIEVLDSLSTTMNSSSSSPSLREKEKEGEERGVEMKDLLPYYLSCYSQMMMMMMIMTANDNDSASPASQAKKKKVEEQLEHYSLLARDYGLVSSLEIGRMYTEQKKYLKAETVLQQVLREKEEEWQRLFEQSNSRNSNSHEVRSVQEQRRDVKQSSEDSEVEGGEEEDRVSSSRRRRRSGLFRYSPSSSTAVSAEERQLQQEESSQRRRRELELELGEIHKAIGLNYLALVQDHRNQSGAMMSPEAKKGYLEEAHRAIVQAMSRGVYDSEIRSFLAAFPSALSTTASANNTDSATTTTAAAALSVEDVDRRDQISERAVEVMKRHYYYPQNRWVVRKPVLPSSSSSSSSGSSTSYSNKNSHNSRSGLQSNRLTSSSSVLEGLEEQLLQESAALFDEESTGEGEGFLSSAFEQLLSQEKERQGYEGSEEEYEED